MRRGGQDEPPAQLPMNPPPAGKTFRKVEAVGVQRGGQPGVGPHKQQDAARAERPEHHPRAARQAQNDRFRVERSDRVGKEQQSGQPLPPTCAVL